MRELKFRAWIKPEDCSDGLMSYEDSHDDIIMISNGNGFAIVENDYYLPDDRFEIMQYTGRKDINEKEIYDGDILKHHGIVKWCNESHKWTAIDLNWNDKREVHELDYLTSPFEVIGNIHENPELLK